MTSAREVRLHHRLQVVADVPVGLTVAFARVRVPPTEVRS